MLCTGIVRISRQVREEEKVKAWNELYAELYFWFSRFSLRIQLLALVTRGGLIFLIF